MTVHEHPTGIVQALTHGWLGSHPDPARALLVQLATKLHGNRGWAEARNDVVLGHLDLPQIRLQGVGRLPCLVLGPQADAASEMRDFWSRSGGPGQLVLVASALKPVLDQARTTAPPHRCIFIGAQEIREILEAPVAKDAFTRIIRSQIPRSRLDPYNVTLPVEGPMFFGRESELSLLRDKESVCYAIAGPGRIGKTSLMLEYARRLQIDRDPRATRLHKLSLYQCGTFDDDTLARHLAIRIAATSMADRVTVDSLTAFLNNEKEREGGPLELLIDEVDEVCYSRAFKMLVQATREKLCRLVLCGRGNLLRAMLDDGHPLGARLALIRPEPLERAEASRLLAEPMSDLGLTLEPPAEIHARIYHLTSGLPHLVQGIAHRLLHRAHRSDSLVITPADLAEVEQDFLGNMIALLPLRDLEDDQSRLGALLLLLHNPRELRLASFVDWMSAAGCPIDARRALEILDDLVICNLLVWARSVYRLANPELGAHARESGFLALELQALRKKLQLHGDFWRGPSSDTGAPHG